MIHKAAIVDTKHNYKLFQPVTSPIKSSSLRYISSNLDMITTLALLLGLRAYLSPFNRVPAVAS